MSLEFYIAAAAAAAAVVVEVAVEVAGNGGISAAEVEENIALASSPLEVSAAKGRRGTSRPCTRLRWRPARLLARSLARSLASGSVSTSVSANQESDRDRQTEEN